MTSWYPIFWLFLAVFALLRLYAVIRDPREIINPLSVVAFGLFFIYVPSYWVLPTAGVRAYLSPAGYLDLLALATLAFVFFAFGFHLGSRGRPGQPVPRYIDARRASRVAFIILIVAATVWFGLLVRAGGILAYYSSFHGTGIDYAGVSAYVYQSRYLFYGALYILLALFVRKRAPRHHLLIILIVAAYLIVDAWLEGRRGEWVMLGMIFAVTFLLVRPPPRTKPSRLLFIGGAAALLFIVLVTPMVRSASYVGSGRGVLGSLQRGLQSRNPLAGSGIKRGNELYFSSSLIDSLNKSGDFDLGKKWLLPFFSFVPRAIWPGKPTWHDWSVSYRHLIASQEGWTLAGGASPTGLADAYARFSWASVLWWGLLGFWGGRLWARARRSRDLIRGGLLSAYLVGLVFFLTQTFNNAFLFWVFTSAPIWAVILWGRTKAKRRTPGRLPPMIWDGRGASLNNDVD